MGTEKIFECVNPITMGMCMCLGNVLKNTFDKFPNKLIPLTMLLIGTIINIIIFKNVMPTNILSGMISGLASTGLYEVFKNQFLDISKKN